MFEEFKQFAVKGNLVDMAVGIILGSAFGKIVSSLVSDIIMPPVGLLLGGVDFSNLRLVLKKASDGTALVAINYGVFINNVIDFFIVAFAMFVVIKQIQKLKKPTKAEKPSVPEEILLLREIRDSLRSKKK